jgi:acyl dehydratase
MKFIEVKKIPNPVSLNLSVVRPGTPIRAVDALPEITYVRPRVVVDARKLAAYSRVCGFSKAHGVPMLFTHIEAFPLAMMLFGNKEFPWPGMGLVHLANQAKLLKRISVGDALRIEVRTGELLAHDKGQAFNLHARALRDGDVVWESTWTLLRLGVRNPKGPKYTSALDGADSLSHQADFFAPAGIGRAYGRASGDVNPIHLFALTAKFLGFKRAIAHGMWTKAKALSLLMPREDVDKAEVIVEFKTPLFLPAKASLWSTKLDSGAVFEVRNAKGDKPHLKGRVTF